MIYNMGSLFSSFSSKLDNIGSSFSSSSKLDKFFIKDKNTYDKID